MQKSFLVPGFLICFFLLSMNQAHAIEPLYEAGTHIDLTSEAIRYYQSKGYFLSLSEADIDNLRRGSTDEDYPVYRSARHFYDYFNQRGFTDITFSLIACGALTCTSAKDWANASIEQANNGGSHTWNDAVAKFRAGDRNGAFYDLGHVLHLLEDMTSVAHTRNDSHVSYKGLFDPDPYETWAGNHPGLFYIDQNGNLTSDPTGNTHILEGTLPIAFSTLGEYFDYLSDYTQRNFFSDDTVKTSAYSEPNLCQDGSPYFPCTKGVQRVINGQTYILYYGRDPLNPSKAVLLAYEKPSGVKTTNHNLINQNYWKRLAREGMQAVAGALDLFLEEVSLGY